MGRFFDPTSPIDYLQHEAAVLTDYPITMACWFRSNNETLAQIVMSIVNSASAINRNALYLQIRGDIAGNPVVAFAADGAGGSGAQTVNGYTVNNWHHACVVFTSRTNRIAYSDGVASTVNTVDRQPSGLNRTTIGGRNQTTSLSPFSGDIAEAGIWNVDLTAEEVVSLSNGMRPRYIRPESLIAYWRLQGFHSPEIDSSGNFDLTVVGAVKSVHPSMQPKIYSKSKSTQVILGTAAKFKLSTTALSIKGRQGSNVLHLAVAKPTIITKFAAFNAVHPGTRVDDEEFNYISRDGYLRISNVVSSGAAGISLDPDDTFAIPITYIRPERVVYSNFEYAPEEVE